MKERRVRFTVTLQGHVDRERTWWLENRGYRRAEGKTSQQLSAIRAVCGPSRPDRRLNRETLSRRRATLQVLEPVLDEDHMRRLDA